MKNLSVSEHLFALCIDNIQRSLAGEDVDCTTTTTTEEYHMSTESYVGAYKMTMKICNPYVELRYIEGIQEHAFSYQLSTKSLVTLCTDTDLTSIIEKKFQYLGFLIQIEAIPLPKRSMHARQMSKMLSFGTIYGSSITQLSSSLNIDTSDEQVKVSINKLLKTFPNIPFNKNP